MKVGYKKETWNVKKISQKSKWLKKKNNEWKWFVFNKVLMKLQGQTTEELEVEIY